MKRVVREKTLVREKEMRTDQGKGVGKDRHWFGHRDEKTKTMLVVVRVITAPDDYWSMLAAGGDDGASQSSW